jgi:hypothetical protein
MGQVHTLRTDNFTGGLNLRADPFQLGETESPDLLNVDIDPRGGIFQRGGVTKYSTAAIGGIADGSFAPEKLFPWQAASPQLLVAANNLVYYSGTTSFTSTTITTTHADGASFAPWTGSSTSVVYVAGGTGTANVAKWDGSAKTNLTASGTGQWQEALSTPTGTHCPRADFNAVHIDRMWVASTLEDGTAYPNRVRFSHPNFPESWRSADYIDVVDGGSAITALVPFNGALLVFKKTSVHAIYGYDTDTFQVVTLTSSLGAASSHCVTTDERHLFLFSWPDGLFAFDGRGFRDMFEKLRPLIVTNQINGGSVAQVWLGMTNNRLWLSLPVGNTTPTYSFVLDISDGAWTRYQFADGKGAAAVCDFVTSTGSRLHLALHPTNPHILNIDQYDVYNDTLDNAGTVTPFTSYYSTRWQDAGVISAKKMWRRPDFVVKQPSTTTTLTVGVYHDWQESPEKRTHQVVVDAGQQTALVWHAVAPEPDPYLGWGEAPWGANASGSQFQRASNLGLARSVMLKIAGEASKPWGVNSITYKYVPRRVR